MPTSWKNGALPRMSSRKKIADYFGMMTNEEILAILRQYPDLVPEVLAILTEAPAKTDLPFVG